MDFFTHGLDIANNFREKKLARLTGQLRNSSVPNTFNSFHKYSFYFYFAMDIQHKVFPQSIRLPPFAVPKNNNAKLAYSQTLNSSDKQCLLPKFFTPSFQDPLLLDRYSTTTLSKLLNPNEHNNHLQNLQQWLDITSSRPRRPLNECLQKLIELQKQHKNNNQDNIKITSIEVDNNAPPIQQKTLDDFSSLYYFYPFIDFQQSFYFWKLNEILLNKTDSTQKAKILHFIQSTSMIAGTAKPDKHLNNITDVKQTLALWERLFQKQGRQILIAATLIEQAAQLMPARFECAPEMTFSFMDNTHNNNVLQNRQNDLTLKSFDELTTLLIDSFFDAPHISHQLVNTIYEQAISHGAVDICFFLQQKMQQKINSNISTNEHLSAEQVCTLLHGSITLSGDSPILPLLKTQSVVDLPESTLHKFFSIHQMSKIKFQQHHRDIWLQRLNEHFFTHWEQPQFHQQSTINADAQLKATIPIDADVMNTLNIQPPTIPVPESIEKPSISSILTSDFFKPNKVEIKNFILDYPKAFNSFCSFLKKIEPTELNAQQKIQYNKINDYIKALPKAITKQINFYSQRHEPNLKNKLAQNLSICEEFLLSSFITEKTQALSDSISESFENQKKLTPKILNKKTL